MSKERGVAIGAYVTATLFEQEDCRQGVLIGYMTNGAALVLGQAQKDPYVCEPDVAAVPDGNIILPSTREHIAAVRADLVRAGGKLGWTRTAPTDELAPSQWLLIEEVARAICAADGADPAVWRNYVHHAIAAIGVMNDD